MGSFFMANVVYSLKYLGLEEVFYNHEQTYFARQKIRI